ncbi:hypothetical protein JRO89_XS12G0239700 [Xanthoceras sorbifolium]|uniref:Aquaporin NIP2-1 n=1 Tax=Xanthoceras sorbifolium TaxID=99658 RepID=A0ABQ8HDL5_9ROSI|nr:hypothetical protein JRO89_XS12G0239700 [Xanthoceras sorbifolium]
MATNVNPNLKSQTDQRHIELVSVEIPAVSYKKKLSLVWKSFGELYPPGFLRKVVAEIIATYLLVFVTCGSASLSANDEHKVAKLGASVAGGLIVTVMIYAVGHISGAHMNPAVTLAFSATRHFPWRQVSSIDNVIVYRHITLVGWGRALDSLGPGPNCDQSMKWHGLTLTLLVPMYAAAQLTGAISAALTLRVLLHPIQRVGTTSPAGTELQALIMEIVVTFSMMFVTSAVGELAGVAVGSAVCITSILAGPVSGGSMNPARTIGPAIASSYYKGIWVYVVGPVTGTLMGAWAYSFIREPVHVMSLPSLSFKLHQMKSNDSQVPDKDPLDSL